jgi:hypothetical protein
LILFPSGIENSIHSQVAITMFGKGIGLLQPPARREILR